jgi:phosphoglycolate phosphatase-like HAD superfamily hydrolase
MIKHLVWDLDGTLFDTYPIFTAAFLEALADFSCYPNPEVVLKLSRVGLSHCATVLGKAYQLSPSALEQGFNQHYSEIPFDNQPLQPGGYALCVYIVSIGGKNVVVTHRQRQSTIGLLKAHGLEMLIADSITGDDGFPKKPNPTAIKIIVARNDIPPWEGLAIGDRAFDIAAGRAAGLRTCLFREVDTRAQPTYRVNHLNEIMEIVRQENLKVE